MKLKNILKFGFLFLAAGMLLTGCGNPAGSPADGDKSDNNISSSSNSSGNLQEVTPKSGDLIATFEIEGFGTIKAVLFPDIAPVGVENFQKLCNDGFYKGLTIHRVMEGFMFQGGSTNGNGTGGEAAVNGGSFGIETSDNARHFYGALCYANAAGQNSTQFYIVNSNEKNPFDNMIKQYDDVINEYKKRAAAASSADEKAFYEYYASQYETAREDYKKEVAAMDPALKKLYNERGGAPSLDGDYTVFGQVYEGFDVIQSISKVEVVEDSRNEKSKPVQTIVIKDITVTEFK
ncbi:MAG: peptidylprolyl isomerase [Oscillospiraceae bacterium]|nr:peptidylprolyl isomerase [Oscillospiraceae bacterium]